MEVTINGERVECALSVKTLMLYEMEFDGADLIGDVSGRVTMADIQDQDEDVPPEEVVLVDFAKIPWLKVMQAVWAMVKTVDDKTPHFDAWSSEVSQVDSWELRQVVNKAVNDSFFHSAASDGEGEGQQQDI